MIWSLRQTRIIQDLYKKEKEEEDNSDDQYFSVYKLDLSVNAVVILLCLPQSSRETGIDASSAICANNLSLQ